MGLCRRQHAQAVHTRARWISHTQCVAQGCGSQAGTHWAAHTRQVAQGHGLQAGARWAALTRWGVQCRARRQGHAVQLTLGRSHWIVSIGVGCFSQVGACRITHGLGHSVPQSHTRRVTQGGISGIGCRESCTQVRWARSCT
jgi:hypothetical protein